MSSEWDLNNFRIAPLVSDQFDDLPVYLIKHKDHLKAQFALSEHMEFHRNGRPKYAEFTMEGVLYLTENWIFTDVEVAPGQKRLTNKKVIVNFIGNDGSKSNDIVTINKDYDPTSLSDGRLIDKDRVLARETVVAEIKTYIGAVFAAGGLTDEQVSNLVKFVWTESLAPRDDFVSLGTSDYSDYLQNADYSEPQRQWLLTDLSGGGGYTLKQYIIDRLAEV